MKPDKCRVSVMMATEYRRLAMSVIKGMNHVALNCHGKEEMDAVLDFY